MSSSSFLRGSALLALAFSALGSAVASADAVSIVFANNKSLPLDALTLQNGKFTVKTPTDGFPATPFNEELASHISGDKPPEIDQAIGLLLMNKPLDAIALLDPLMEKHKITARIPGNYWVETARAALVAYSINRSTTKCEEIGKALSDATPAAGDDPQIALSKAMLTPLSVKIDDRIAALAALASDSSPAEVSAYACFFRGNLLKTAKRLPEALEAYLSISGVYPTCGRVLNGAAELNGAELLANMKRRPEALLLLDAAARDAKGTAIGAEAEKRIPLVK
jgi:tetratricopeptide (TPR) repeat protein